MQVLVTGGAGHVGKILRPAIEEAHEVRYLDLTPVEPSNAQTIVGSVTDPDAVREAMQGVDAVVHLAMALERTVDDKKDLSPLFEVNVHGTYCVVKEAMRAGVSRFVYTSTLSVYKTTHQELPWDEQANPDAWKGYGVSKWLGEQVCRRASELNPDVTFSILRLMLPVDDASKCRAPGEPHKGRRHSAHFPLGPKDTQRLYLSTLELDQPGVHIMHATGDVEGAHTPNRRAAELLGWAPRNE